MKKLLILVLLLNSCATKLPEATTYRLPVPAVSTGGTELVYIAPARVAASINTRGVLYQMDEVSYREASNHKWAAGLGQLIQESVAGRLGQSLTQYTYTTRKIDGSITVNSIFTAFHGRYDGTAQISGQWFIEQTGKIKVLPFTYTVDMQRDGYLALVEALSAGLNQATAELAKGLAEGK